jgi:hypothetical protein
VEEMMQLNVTREVAALERMTIQQLRERYAAVFGEATSGRNKAWLIRRIAWRLQANAEGDLSERARRRAEELANDADIRVTMPRAKPNLSREPLLVQVSRHQLDERLPPPGTIITRPYKGGSVQVKVLPEGFEYLGEVFLTLSAVAKAVTGSHCNGFSFFRLGKTSSKGGGS